MKNIPTAGEFLKKNNYHHSEDYEFLLVKFAKLHVTEALKAASLEAHTRDVPYTDDCEVDPNSILEAYPLNNIK